MQSEDLPDDASNTLSFGRAIVIASPWGHVCIIVEHVRLQCNAIHVRNHGCLNPKCETLLCLTISMGGMLIALGNHSTKHYKFKP